MKRLPLVLAIVLLGVVASVQAEQPQPRSRVYLPLVVRAGKPYLYIYHSINVGNRSELPGGARIVCSGSRDGAEAMYDIIVTYRERGVEFKCHSDTRVEAARPLEIINDTLVVRLTNLDAALLKSNGFRECLTPSRVEGDIWTVVSDPCVAP